jgi:hypothetical protein
LAKTQPSIDAIIVLKMLRRINNKQKAGEKCVVGEATTAITGLAGPCLTWLLRHMAPLKCASPMKPPDLT